MDEYMSKRTYQTIYQKVLKCNSIYSLTKREILRRSGRTSYNVWMPKSEGKINAYEKIIVLMMDALNGGNKNQNQIQYND